MKELMISVYSQTDGSFLITAENEKFNIQTTSNERFIILKVILLQFRMWLKSLFSMF